MHSNLEVCTCHIFLTKLPFCLCYFSWKVVIEPVNISPKLWVSWYDQSSCIPLLVKPAQNKFRELQESCSLFANLISPRPPPTVAKMQTIMAVFGYVATRHPYQVKNLSKELITPYWQSRAEINTHFEEENENNKKAHQVFAILSNSGLPFSPYSKSKANLDYINITPLKLFSLTMRFLFWSTC